MNDLVAQNTELDTQIGMTTPVSWTAPADFTWEQYQSIGSTFQQMQHSLAWWVGDWLNFGEKKFGEMYLQAVEDTNKSLETLMKWKAVSDRVHKNVRQEGLSWTHHFYVAYIEEDQRGDLLVMALNMGLSSRELKDVTKLEWARREDLMIAAREGIEREAFLRLVNRFRLGDRDEAEPKQIEEDNDEDTEDTEEEELPFSDLGDDDYESLSDEPEHIGLSCENVQDYWENKFAPLILCGANQAIWEGIAVRAAQDASGRLILVWEEIT